MEPFSSCLRVVGQEAHIVEEGKICIDPICLIGSPVSFDGNRPVLEKDSDVASSEDVAAETKHREVCGLSSDTWMVVCLNAYGSHVERRRRSRKSRHPRGRTRASREKTG